MICEPCKRAGKVNQIGLTDMAKKEHKKCEYPATCPCQHQTGKGWLQGGK